MQDREARIAWFKTIILPHEAALRRRLRQMGTQPQEVEDLVAEALARAYAAQQWAAIDQGRAYLFTIARNLILDAARRSKVVSFDSIADINLLDIVDDSPSSDAVVSAREEWRRLREAVAALPERARDVFLLRRIDNLSTQQVADRLGLSVSTVEKHLAKAMALLTEAMAESDPFGATQTGPAWRRADERDK